MTNKYGQAALLAAQSSGNPVDRWLTATATIFPKSPSSQVKGCPKGAFLGLCEEGHVKGIEPGTYTTSKDNKRYALHGLALLQDGHPSDNSRALWNSVMNGRKKAHNSQTDVLLALWNVGLRNKHKLS